MVGLSELKRTIQFRTRAGSPEYCSKATRGRTRIRFRSTADLRAHRCSE